MILAVLSLGGIAYALLQSLVVPALPEIQRSLHTSESAVGWVLTAFSSRQSPPSSLHRRSSSDCK